MMCPICTSVDVEKIDYDPKTEEVTYECQHCHDIFVMSTKADDEIKPPALSVA